MSTVLANPAKMIAHGAPRVIHNDEELEAYTAALFELTALKKALSRRGRSYRTANSAGGALRTEALPDSCRRPGLSGAVPQVRKLRARFKLPADVFIAKR
jgi:hypothetical protein